MLLIISPAKIQNFDPQEFISEYTLPEYLDEAEILIDKLREISFSELAELLNINSSLTQINADRHFSWQRPFTPKNTKQTVFVFNGEVFHGLDAKSMSKKELTYLQSNLRILSGLYGVLRPFDLIQPYRLDVSTRLKTDAGDNLYAFWGNKITEALNKVLDTQKEPKILLNLTSGEYLKSINKKLLNARIIDFEFLEYKNDTYKIIVVYTKKARGMMVRYVVENSIEDIENLKGFNMDGYWYNPHLSTENKLVFVR